MGDVAAQKNQVLEILRKLLHDVPVDVLDLGPARTDLAGRVESLRLTELLRILFAADRVADVVAGREPVIHDLCAGPARAVRLRDLHDVLAGHSRDVRGAFRDEEHAGLAFGEFDAAIVQVHIRLVIQTDDGGTEALRDDLADRVDTFLK